MHKAILKDLLKIIRRIYARKYRLVFKVVFKNFVFSILIFLHINGYVKRKIFLDN